MNKKNHSFLTQDEKSLQEFSREDFLDLMFINELKSFGKDGTPNEKFVEKFSQELKSKFREQFSRDAKTQKIEFSQESVFFSWQKFFFPLSTMILLLAIVSLGFANIGEHRVQLAEKNKEPLPKIEQKNSNEKNFEENDVFDSSSLTSVFPKESEQNAFVREIDALELLMNEQKNDFKDLDGDLAFYEESVDGDFSLIESDLETIFQ